MLLDSYGMRLHASQTGSQIDVAFQHVYVFICLDTLHASYTIHIYAILYMFLLIHINCIPIAIYRCYIKHIQTCWYARYFLFRCPRLQNHSGSRIAAALYSETWKQRRLQHEERGAEPINLGLVEGHPYELTESLFFWVSWRWLVENVGIEQLKEQRGWSVLAEWQ